MNETACSSLIECLYEVKHHGASGKITEKERK